MAIVKGDRLPESEKLAKCSLLAAAFYPWFLGARFVDDFGRFRLLVPVIWATLFHRRPDVKLRHVQGWFGEYVKVGLLQIYEGPDGQLAEWSNWMGMPTSKQRFHRQPEPPWSTHVCSTRCENSRNRLGTATVPTRNDPPSSTSTPSTPNEQKRDGAVAPGALAGQVFEHWRTVMAHAGAKYTAERRRKVEARLREGYTVEQLCRAVDGCRASRFHQGENEDGKVYDDLTLICRNGSKVEQFIAGLNGKAIPEKTRRANETAQQAAEQIRARREAEQKGGRHAV